MFNLLHPSSISINTRFIDWLCEEPLGCFVDFGTPWLFTTSALNHPEFKLFLVPIYRTVCAPSTPMTIPSVITVLFRCRQAKRISTKTIGTCGYCEQIFHGFFFQDTHTIISYAKIHQHLIEFQLIVCGC